MRKRLTVKNKKGKVCLSDGKEMFAAQEGSIPQKAIERLYLVENALEARRVLELPAKIDDKAYYYDNAGKRVNCHVAGYILNRRGLYIRLFVYREPRDGTGRTFTVAAREIGRSLFLLP